MKTIIPGLYTFSGLIAGRVYMIDDPDGVTLVDTGLGFAADRVLSQLQAAGRAPTDVKRILITHAHMDHLGGLPKLKEASGAEVICSAGERPVVEGKIPAAQTPRERVPGIWKLIPTPPQKFTGTPVDREVIGGDVLPEVMGGLHVIATPGHAPDHISFWQPERRVLIIGDVLMRLFGRVRLPFAAYTVDMEQNKRSIARLTEYDARVACFGHGEPITENAAEVIRGFAQRLGVI